jgi:hypothetical protein
MQTLFDELFFPIEETKMDTIYTEQFISNTPTKTEL